MKLINWNCNIEVKKLENNSIDLCIIDPPYNVNYKYWSYKDNLKHKEYINWQIWLLDEIWIKLKDWWSLIYITYPELWAEIFTEFLYEWYSIQSKEIATWVYNTNLWWKYLRKASRMCVWLSKWEPKVNNIQWEYKNPNDKRIKKRIEQWLLPKEIDWFYFNQVKNVSKEHNHPCELPQWLLEKFTKWLSKKWDIILDCFMWSWSLWITCKNLDRKFIWIELDENYFNIAKDRIKRN